jgi:excisionase family DNA binding protein
VSVPAVVVLTVSLDELRAVIRDELRATLAAHASSPSAAPLVDRREVARLLNVSAATVTRMTAEGMPHVFAGASPRYSVDEVHAWLDARGRRGTKSTPPKRETIAGVRLLSRGARQ